MKIKKITEIRPQRVFAIQTSTGTFIADGLAHHNCYHCNIGLKGNWVEYEKAMVEMYGRDKVEEFKNLSKGRSDTIKFTVSDYLKIEEKYKEKVKLILDKQNEK